MHADSATPWTEQVLGAVFEVSNTRGAGLLEKVYQRALLHELRLRGIGAEVSFPVTYKGHGVGEYFADLLVEDSLVVELKCAERLSNEHTAQCLNYLRASGRRLCLLVSRNPRSSGSESSTDFRVQSRWRRGPWPSSHYFLCLAICGTLHWCRRELDSGPDGVMVGKIQRVHLRGPGFQAA